MKGSNSHSSKVDYRDHGPYGTKKRESASPETIPLECAIIDDSKAIGINPKHAETYYNRGVDKYNADLMEQFLITTKQ